MFNNLFFSLCISINLNQTAVGLFWLGKKYENNNDNKEAQ